jgi:hypothetical protein
MVMVIQIKYHIVAGLRPIGTGQSARESCIFVENSYKLPKMAKLVFGRLLLLPSWRDLKITVGRLGRDKRRKDPCRPISSLAGLWRLGRSKTWYNIE